MLPLMVNNLILGELFILTISSINNTELLIAGNLSFKTDFG